MVVDIRIRCIYIKKLCFVKENTKQTKTSIRHPNPLNPENKGIMQTECFPRDLNPGPLALQHRDPLCQATLCRCPASEFVLIYSFA